jgi:hypothetical protein
VGTRRDEVAASRRQDSEVVMRIRPRGIESDRRLEVSGRLGIATLPREDDAEMVVRFGRRGIDREEFADRSKSSTAESACRTTLVAWWPRGSSPKSVTSSMCEIHVSGNQLPA